MVAVKRGKHIIEHLLEGSSGGEDGQAPSSCCSDGRGFGFDDMVRRGATWRVCRALRQVLLVVVNAIRGTI